MIDIGTHKRLHLQTDFDWYYLVA